MHDPVTREAVDAARTALRARGVKLSRPHIVAALEAAAGAPAGVGVLETEEAPATTSAACARCKGMGIVKDEFNRPQWCPVCTSPAGFGGAS